MPSHVCIHELLSLIATWEKLCKGLDYLLFFFFYAAKEVPATGIWGANGTLFHNLFNHWKQLRSRSVTSVHRLSCEQPCQSTGAEGRAWPVLNIISVDLYGLLQCNDCWFWALIACVWQNHKGSQVYYCFDTVSKGKLFTSILIQPFVNTQQRKMLSPILLLVEPLSFLWL